MKSFDRSAEDLGNIIHLEHVNTTVPDQRLATAFYVSALGLTRDPYLVTGVENMWINVGRSQFHLPTGAPQVLRGRVGLRIPNRDFLLKRLASARRHLDGTLYAFREEEDWIDTVTPWGNRIRCYPTPPDAGAEGLGMCEVEFTVAPGAAAPIARFYRDVLQAPAEVARDNDGPVARVAAGMGQELRFRETDAAIPAYDGHHIQIYVAHFSGPYRRLLERGRISEESDQHQYRFKDIIDVGSGALLFEIEHEVRSLRHPLYARPLVNRNPAQTNMRYQPGYDSWR
jgi:catechol 2,3-dioxygenase-like lactoylglutathione lyase family enzyme